MDITLTQKDADFILKYIRNDLRVVTESVSSLDEKYNNLLKSCTDEIKDVPYIVEVMKVAKEAKTTADEESQGLKANLEHCIELLTCGSEM